MTLMSRVREHTYTVVENEAVGDGIWRMVFRAPKLAVHELLAGILGKVVPACHYFASAQLLP